MLDMMRTANLRGRVPLENAFAALGADWLMLRDGAFTVPSGTVVLDYVVIHREHGIALLGGTPSGAVDPVACCREWLRQQGFFDRFPGFLPIVHLVAGREDAWKTVKRIVTAFDETPPLTLPPGWSTALAELLAPNPDAGQAPGEEPQPTPAKPSLDADEPPLRRGRLSSQAEWRPLLATPQQPRSGALRATLLLLVGAAIGAGLLYAVSAGLRFGSGSPAVATSDPAARETLPLPPAIATLPPTEPAASPTDHPADAAEDAAPVAAPPAGPTDHPAGAAEEATPVAAPPVPAAVPDDHGPAPSGRPNRARATPANAKPAPRRATPSEIDRAALASQPLLDSPVPLMPRQRSGPPIDVRDLPPLDAPAPAPSRLETVPPASR
jgi:hypothetical protein